MDPLSFSIFSHVRENLAEAGMADYDYRTALHLASSNGNLAACLHRRIRGWP